MNQVLHIKKDFDNRHSAVIACRRAGVRNEPSYGLFRTESRQRQTSCQRDLLNQGMNKISKISNHPLNISNMKYFFSTLIFLAMFTAANATTRYVK
ncbi:MAG: hypothetical protein LBS09_03375, partial [Bacteroidales bacterium]|nr:hypothetical protein [Bacteroidales bacterium]